MNSPNTSTSPRPRSPSTWRSCGWRGWCTRRDKTTIFYSLENEHVRQLVIDAVFNAEHAGPGVPRHHRSDGGLQAVTDA